MEKIISKTMLHIESPNKYFGRGTKDEMWLFEALFHG
jgi:hypothetical protein